MTTGMSAFLTTGEPGTLHREPGRRLIDRRGYTDWLARMPMIPRLSANPFHPSESPQGFPTKQPGALPANSDVGHDVNSV